MTTNGYTNGHGPQYDQLNSCKTVDGFVKEGDVEKFVQAALQLTVKEGLQKAKDRNNPVVNFKAPDDLAKCIDFELHDEPESHHTLLRLCQGVFDCSVKTGHPHFFNQLYAGLDPYAFIGQVITDVLNPSIYTYEVAPVFVLMENVLLKKFRDIIGYKQGDGTFSPGGSYSNMLGLNLARFSKFPQVKEKGMRNLPRMVAFSSAHSHYSNKKNASLMGIGTDDLIPVKTDELGRMDTEDLERRVLELRNEGAVPIAVIATAGTTVFGAFDPLNQIADICQKYGIWMHVDAAWGGAVMLTEKHRNLCQGIHRSDSVTWNPHKMMMAPLQCCVFVTKHAHILKECHSIHVPYLFQQDKTLYSSEFDVGTKVVQCGRKSLVVSMVNGDSVTYYTKHVTKVDKLDETTFDIKVDALKLWLMWKARGTSGLKRRIEKAFDNSRYLTELINKREGFKLVSEPQCTNVCFWYLPKRLRDLKWNLNDEDFCRQVASIPPKIKEQMTKQGSMLVGYQPVGNLPNFFRMVVINDEVGHKDMEFVVNEIERIGQNL